MIQTFDPALVGLVAHALNNYITVTSATVEMLQLTLRDFATPTSRSGSKGSATPRT